MDPVRRPSSEVQAELVEAYTSKAQAAGAAKVVSLPLLARLQHVLHCPRRVGPSAYWDSVFDLWVDVWVDTFLEVGAKPPASSDDFMLQDEISTVHDDGEPIGFFCYRWVNLRSRAHLRASFFRHFAREGTDALLHAGHERIMIMNFLTVSPAWRRRRQGFGVSELLVGLATKRFLASEATALVAYTRNDRRTHELGYRYGATPLVTDRVVHGIDSHSIAILRENVRETTVPGIPQQVDRLWRETSMSFDAPNEETEHEPPASSGTTR